MELLFIRMELEAAGIPHLVLGQHFGSLYPGVQLPWYNERTVLVPEERLAEAQALIEAFRQTYQPPSLGLSGRSRLRMLLEAVFFGWALPGGCKKSVIEDASPSSAPPPHGDNAGSSTH